MTAQNESCNDTRHFTPEDVVRCYVDIQREMQSSQDIRNPRDILGWEIEYIEPASLLVFLDYCLFRRLNDFIADRDNPVILDCGANIGYTVLNYKRLYPNSEIIAFEPDPSFLPVLRRNLTRNGAHDVRVVDSAVWTSNGIVDWLSFGSDGSRIVSKPRDRQGIITVSAVDLQEYVGRTIDLLKLDIEGSEYAVIEHLEENLRYVKNILIECHLDQTNICRFAETLQRLSSSGFVVSIDTYGYWRDLVRQPAWSPPYSEQYAFVSGTRQPAREASTAPTLMPYYGITHEIGLMELRSSLEQRYSTMLTELKLSLEQTSAQQQEWERERYSAVVGWLLDGSRERVHRIDLHPPFQHQDRNSWTISIPEFSSSADSNENPSNSKLFLLEDGRLLGPEHAVHDDICKTGGGFYSHWTSCLYFSTSDNSDPNTNGRRYTAFVPE